MDFKKYLKYKKKYLNLKNKYIMKGGGYFHEKNQIDRPKPMKTFMNCVIKLEIKNPSAIHSYLSSNLNKIDFEEDTQLVSIHDLHMTLLSIEINLSHRLNLIKDPSWTGNPEYNPNNNFCYIIDDIFGNKIKWITEKFNNFLIRLRLKEKFIEIFKNIEIETSDYGIMGRDNKFFVQRFNINNQNKISEFRKYFYDNLLNYVKSIDKTIQNKTVEYTPSGPIPIYDSTPKQTPKPKTPKYISNFTLIKYKNGDEPLFAIPDYYWGLGNFDAHISLCKLTKELNQAKINEYKNKTIYKNIKFIFNDENIKNVKFE